MPLSSLSENWAKENSSLAKVIRHYLVHKKDFNKEPADLKNSRAWWVEVKNNKLSLTLRSKVSPENKNAIEALLTEIYPTSQIDWNLSKERTYTEDSIFDVFSEKFELDETTTQQIIDEVKSYAVDSSTSWTMSESLLCANYTFVPVNYLKIKYYNGAELFPKQYELSRKEYIDVLNDFFSNTSQPAKVCCYGLKDSGKTTIATKYFLKDQEEKYRIRISCKAGSRSELIKSYYEVGLVNGLYPKEATYEEAIPLVLNQLKKYRSGWLLVLDNVPVYTEQNPETHIDDLIPERCGHILITSREPKPGFKNVEVAEELSLEDAKALMCLVTHYQFEGKQEQLSQLIKLVGRTPQAIKQAVEILEKLNFSFSNPKARGYYCYPDGSGGSIEECIKAVGDIARPAYHERVEQLARLIEIVGCSPLSLIRAVEVIDLETIHFSMPPKNVSLQASGNLGLFGNTVETATQGKCSESIQNQCNKPK